jgi:hypothetical protein
MTIMISLPDPLLDQLRLRAEAERVSVDELASSVLAEAMQQPLHPEKWGAQNRRRLALIRKRLAQGLSAAEKQELNALQELADRQLEASDRQMLADVQSMKRAVEASVATDAG